MSSNLVVLSSRDRVAGTSNSFSYQLSENLTGIFTLTHFQMTNNIFNVVAENSSVYIEHSVDGQFTLVVEPGYYTAESLRVELATTLTALLPSTTISVALDTVTNQYLFSSSSGDIRFTFATNTLNSARYLLGFGEEDTAFAADVESTKPIDLKLHDMIVVAILQDNKQTVTLPTGVEASFIIPLGNTPFGDRINFLRGTAFPQLCQFTSSLSHLDIRLYSIDGDLLDVNGAEWTMSLSK